MLQPIVYDYIHSLHKIPDPLERIKGILRGCIQYFPFNRASIYTYSPITHRGEGVLLLENGQFYPMTGISEDTRNIPAIHMAITTNQPHLINIEPNGKNYPLKYIQQFNLTSLLIIPICFKHIVIGLVLLDHFSEKVNLKNYDYMGVYDYYQESAAVFFQVQEQKKSLSRREIEVLQRLSYGYSLKEMASSMGISEFTVRDYLTSVNRKLGTRHRAEAVGVALRTGLIH